MLKFISKSFKIYCQLISVISLMLLFQVGVNLFMGLDISRLYSINEFILGLVIFYVLAIVLTIYLPNNTKKEGVNNIKD